MPSVPVRAYLPPASRPRHDLSCFFRSRLANGRRYARFYATNSVAEIIEPVDEWRVHETSNREKRSQGQGKHHSEKVKEKSATRIHRTNRAQIGREKERREAVEPWGLSVSLASRLLVPFIYGYTCTSYFIHVFRRHTRCQDKWEVPPLQEGYFSRARVDAHKGH